MRFRKLLAVAPTAYAHEVDYERSRSEHPSTMKSCQEGTSASATERRMGKRSCPPTAQRAELIGKSVIAMASRDLYYVSQALEREGQLCGVGAGDRIAASRQTGVRLVKVCQALVAFQIRRASDI